MIFKMYFIRILLGITLCGGLCCGGTDDDNYNYTRLEGTVENATVLETSANGYRVNDTLFITTNIPFDFMQNGNVQNINDVEGLNENSTYDFYFTLTKESQFGNDVVINVNPINIISIVGESQFYSEGFRLVTERDSDSFKHRFGIVLKETGNFSLRSFTYNPDYIMAYNFYGPATTLTLYSNLTPVGSEPKFAFTVLP